MRHLNAAGRVTAIGMAACLLVALATCATRPARSATLSQMSGNDLARHCAPTPGQGLEFASAMLCMGYLTGVLDVLATGAQIAGRRACVPRKADENQIVDVVMGYLRSHPETRHMPALPLVAQAFGASFPCH